jgi:phosphatidylglycerophosphatase A
MCISLLFVPITVQWIVTALVLFRFFDIVKPLYIRKAEALPGGWGVMTDDILAGVYSNIVLQGVIYFI